MALVLETMTGKPFEAVKRKGEKEKQAKFTNVIEGGKLELTAEGILGSKAKGGEVLVSFYQEPYAEKDIEAAKVSFDVIRSIVAIQGFNPKGEIWGSQLLNEGEGVQVFVRNGGKVEFCFMARNRAEVENSSATV